MAVGYSKDGDGDPVPKPPLLVSVLTAGGGRGATGRPATNSSRQRRARRSGRGAQTQWPPRPTSPRFDGLQGPSDVKTDVCGRQHARPEARAFLLLQGWRWLQVVAVERDTGVQAVSDLPVPRFKTKDIKLL